MRELECDFGMRQKVDGSVLYQQGETRVTCGVCGPAEVQVHKELVDKATLNCVFKPKVGLSGVREKAIEDIVRKTCEQVVLVKLFPRSAIQVVVQLMHDAGGLLSSIINGACMALVHAGVPMKCMVASVCCAITTDGDIVVDPPTEVEKDCRCTMTLSFKSTKLKLISSHTTGSFSMEEYFNCMEVARKSASEILSFQRLSYSRFLSRDNDAADDDDMME